MKQRELLRAIDVAFGKLSTPADGAGLGAFAQWAAILSLLLGALFVVGFGLLIGSFLHTTAECNAWAGLSVVVLSLPTWFVELQPPELVRQLLRFIPTTYLTQALSASLSESTTLAETSSNLLVLLASVLIVYGLLWRQMRRDA